MTAQPTRQKATPANSTTRSDPPLAARNGDGRPACEPGAQTIDPVADGPDGTPPVDVPEYRRRWARARRVISEAVGAEESHDPAIWERGAYQLLLWLLVERLVLGSDELNVGDLASISRMLHDQRKLSLDEAKHRQKTDTSGQAETGTAQLPAHFGDLIRQIYGTNFQDDCDAAVAGAGSSD